MKGIILAGGLGTRLYPITKSISKQLLPVFNKPMIYFPINTLINIGIKEILIITTPHDNLFYKNLLGGNTDFNVSFSFEIQSEPKGIADAIIIGKDFLDGDSVCLILGDNLFFHSESIFDKKLIKSSKIFIKKVKNPNNYGVLEIRDNKPFKIHEKPKKYISDYAVVGIYMYKNSVVDFAKEIKPSKRGELEITDLNNIYINANDTKVIKLSKEMVWFDSGSFESLLDASNYVRNNNL